MNFFEAMEALRQGKKVRRVTWLNGLFLYLWADKICNEKGDLAVFQLPIHLSEENWEIFEEPKPKVKRWKWRVKEGDSLYDSLYWFTKEQAEKFYQDCLIGPWAGPEEFDE